MLMYGSQPESLITMGFAEVTRFLFLQDILLASPSRVHMIEIDSMQTNVVLEDSHKEQ